MKNSKFFITLLIIACCLSLNCYGYQVENHAVKASSRVIWHANFWRAVQQDYKEHYSGVGLVYLGATLGAGGLLANTSLDKDISQHWQNHIRGRTTDELSSAVDTFTQLRQIRVVIPTYLTAMAVSHIIDSPWTHPVGLWGEHSIRVLLLGAPQQAILTEVLGAHRPFDESGWSLFDGNRGVSGHAFYGAVPLVSAAAVSETWQLKALFYTLSTLPALSRINTNKHYFSQAALGWGLAFLSSQSVQRANHTLNQAHKLQFSIQPMNGGILMGARIEF